MELNKFGLKFTKASGNKQHYTNQLILFHKNLEGQDFGKEVSEYQCRNRCQEDSTRVYE
jgi:hypothetical protein